MHEHGWPEINKILRRAAAKSGVLILELALREESLYWGPSQPEDPRNLLNGIAFVREVARHNTHLTPISRPLFLASNNYWILNERADKFFRWSSEPHAIAHNTHQSSRQYFFGQRSILKHYLFDHPRGDHNKLEFRRELNFLVTPPKSFGAPKLISHLESEFEAWLAMEIVPGQLLLEKIQQGTSIDKHKVIASTLLDLVNLEEAGLYHNDVRVWNVLVDDQSKARLIDFGSVSETSEDCSWPKNIYLSFFIFINEVITGEIDDPSLLRSTTISPYRLPEKYRELAAELWQQPMEKWSFRLMHEILNSKRNSEASKVLGDPSLTWMSSIEEAIQHQKTTGFNTNNTLELSQNKLHGLVSGLSEKLEADEHELRQLIELVRNLSTELKSSINHVTELERELSNSNEKIAELLGNRSIDESTRHTALKRIISLENETTTCRTAQDALSTKLEEFERRLFTVEDSNPIGAIKHKILKPTALSALAIAAAVFRPMPRIKQHVIAWTSHRLPNIYKRISALRAQQKPEKEQEQVGETLSAEDVSPKPSPSSLENSKHFLKRRSKRATPEEALNDPTLATLARPASLETLLSRKSSSRQEELDPVVALDQMRRSAASVCFVISVNQNQRDALSGSIQSILRQTDPSWEIILCHESGSNSLVSEWLDIDWRIRAMSCNGSTSSAKRLIDASKVSTSDFLGLVEVGDTIDDDLVRRVSGMVSENEHLGLIYTDEAGISIDGEICNPVFKPDWSPEHQNSVNMVGRFLAVRKGYLLNMEFQPTESEEADEYLLIAKLITHCTNIGHIDDAMYIRGRSADGANCGRFSETAIEASRSGLQDHLRNIDPKVVVVAHKALGTLEVQWEIPTNTPVTLLILTAMQERNVPGRGNIYLRKISSNQ
ncbi:MAG: hypothetical protein R3E42_05545 [Burkholderiaceae bacterium]